MAIFPETFTLPRLFCPESRTSHPLSVPRSFVSKGSGLPSQSRRVARMLSPCSSSDNSIPAGPGRSFMERRVEKDSVLGYLPDGAHWPIAQPTKTNATAKDAIQEALDIEHLHREV